VPTNVTTAVDAANVVVMPYELKTVGPGYKVSRIEYWNTVETMVEVTSIEVSSCIQVNSRSKAYP